MSVTAPKRSEAIIVRLSKKEKDRLVRTAIASDQRFGQLARRYINAGLHTDTDELNNDRAAH